MFHHLLLKLSLSQLENALAGNEANLADFLSELFTFLIGLAAVLSMLMIVYGGFLYMTAGATGKVNDAKDKIKNAILGLVLALSSYMILSFINPGLVELNLPSFEKKLHIADNWSGWEVMLPTQDPDSPLPPLARCETDTRCSAGSQCCDEDGNCKDDFPGFKEELRSESLPASWLPDSIIKQAVAAEKGKEEEEEEETIYRCRSDEDMVVTGLNSECPGGYSDCPDERLTCYLGKCEPKKGERQSCEPKKRHCQEGLSCTEHPVLANINICLPAGYQPGQEEDQEKEADTIRTHAWYHLDANKIYLYRPVYKDIKVNQDNEVPKGYERVTEDKDYKICEEKVLEQVHKVLTWEGSLFSWTEGNSATLYRIPSGGKSCTTLGDKWEKTNRPICNTLNKKGDCCSKIIKAYNCYIKKEERICQKQETKTGQEDIGETADMEDCYKHPEFSSNQRLPMACCRVPITENMAKSAEFVKNNLDGTCDNLILHNNADSKITVLTEAIKSLFSEDNGVVSFNNPIIKENLGGNSPTKRILKGYTYGQVICGKEYMKGY